MLPVLRTSRLVLRPAREADVVPLWQLWRTPDVRRFLWDDREIPQDEAAEVIEELRALEPSGMGLWIVTPAAPKGAGTSRGTPPPLIGCAAISPASVAAQFEPAIAGMAEPLVALARPQWGQGFAAETLAAVISYAFERLALPELAGVTDVPNVASDRMLRRAGFVAFSEVAGPKYPMRIYRLSAGATHAPTDATPVR